MLASSAGSAVPFPLPPDPIRPPKIPHPAPRLPRASGRDPPLLLRGREVFVSDYPPSSHHSAPAATKGPPPTGEKQQKSETGSRGQFQNIKSPWITQPKNISHTGRGTQTRSLTRIAKVRGWHSVAPELPFRIPKKKAPIPIPKCPNKKAQHHTQP